MVAGNNGHVPVCEMLLNMGADIDQMNNVCDIYMLKCDVNHIFCKKILYIIVWIYVINVG